MCFRLLRFIFIQVESTHQRRHSPHNKSRKKWFVCLSSVSSSVIPKIFIVCAVHSVIIDDWDSGEFGLCWTYDWLLFLTHSQAGLFADHICWNCSSIIYLGRPIYCVFVNVSWCCWLNSIMHFRYILYMTSCNWFFIFSSFEVYVVCYFVVVGCFLFPNAYLWRIECFIKSPIIYTFIVYFYTYAKVKVFSDS